MSLQWDPEIHPTQNLMLLEKVVQITFLRVSLDMRADTRIRNASQIALERREKYQTDLDPIHVSIISVCEVKCHGSCHPGSGHILQSLEILK